MAMPEKGNLVQHLLNDIVQVFESISCHLRNTLA